MTEPNGTFENVLGLMFAAPVPPSTPLDKDATNNPPPASGPFMISKVNAPRTLTMERNPNFQTVKDAGASEVADANVDKIIVNENKNNSAQVTDVEQNKVDFMLDPPVADRLAEVKAKYSDRFRMEDSINTYYFFMNMEKPRSTTSRSARPSTTRSIPKRSTGSSVAGCTRRSRSCRRACPATRSTSSTPART